ncbi:MAG: Ig-like domain-containing protein [Bacteroidota bacterium]|nr:Ig-like domain-containing protein [Bacteroidota bacterium]
MKKTLLLMFSSLVLFGCSKELTETPIVTSIQLNKSDLTLQIGDSYAFKVTYKSETAKQPEYTWSTSNQSVLSVTSDGEIKALSVGNAKLIVRTTDTGIADTCNVVVSPILVTSFTLSYPSTEFEVNQTMTISATYTPSNATYKKLLFESSNITVATVKDSVITAKAAGNTTIKATTMDGSNITWSFNLVVKEVPVTLDNRLVGTKWQTEDIVYEMFFGKTAYDVYEFISTSEVENYTKKNGSIVQTNGTLKYILKYPTLSIVKNDTTTYDFEFKDSRTIVRVGANEYAAYMKYIKQ